MYFNSIKVQLEQLIGGSSSMINIKFQFHKGTIRTWDFGIRKLSSHNFNSIKVQLEQELGADRLPPSSFQFHKGTIRTILS